MKKYIAIWDANQQISVTAIKNIIEHEDAKLLLFYDKENKHEELINNPNISFIDLNSDSVEALYENLQYVDVLNQFIVIDKNLTDDFAFSDPSDIEASIDTHLKKPVSLLRRLLPLLARYPGQFVSNDEKEAKKYRIQLFQVHNSEHQKNNTSPLDTYFNNVLNQTPFTHLNYKSTFIYDQYQNFFGQTIVDIIEDNSVYFLNDSQTSHAETMVSEVTNHPEPIEPVETSPVNLPKTDDLVDIKSNNVQETVGHQINDPIDHHVAPFNEPKTVEAAPSVSSFANTNFSASSHESIIKEENQPQANYYDNSHDYFASANAIETNQASKLEAAQVDLQRQVNQLKQEYLDVLAKKNKANIEDNQDEYLTDAARRFKEQALSMAKEPVEDYSHDYHQIDESLQSGLSGFNIAKKKACLTRWVRQYN